MTDDAAGPPSLLHRRHLLPVVAMIALVTLGALSLATAVATWVVRRRDLVSVIVAPPLVFVAVALVNIALAPSATFNLPTIATLLVRGFPAMAIPTGIALVLGLIRMAARR